MTYTALDLDDLRDQFNTGVEVDDARGLNGRVGVSFDRENS
ncbi:MAG: hypothetical protein ACI9NT_001945 [Bacteroidia bacterium]|jgi:hypothetical protein